MTNTPKPISPDPKAHTFLGSLHYNTAISAELGALMGEFASLEFLLVKIMSEVLKEGSDMTMSHQILGCVQSVWLRSEIVRRCTEKSDLDDGRKAAVAGAITAAREINSMRNQYLHGLYETNQVTGEVTRTTWPHDVQRNSEVSTITEESVREDREKVIRTHSAIIAALWAAEVKPYAPPS